MIRSAMIAVMVTATSAWAQQPMYESFETGVPSEWNATGAAG